MRLIYIAQQGILNLRNCSPVSQPLQISLPSFLDLSNGLQDHKVQMPEDQCFGDQLILVLKEALGTCGVIVDRLVECW